ncbi:MAG: hypothetical protein WBA57_24700, partial [Elainellaceae cyanobacterium]
SNTATSGVGYTSPPEQPMKTLCCFDRQKHRVLTLLWQKFVVGKGHKPVPASGIFCAAFLNDGHALLCPSYRSV